MKPHLPWGGEHDGSSYLFRVFPLHLETELLRATWHIKVVTSQIMIELSELQVEVRNEEDSMTHNHLCWLLKTSV